MNEKLSKILSLVTGIISLIAVYFLIRIIMEGDDAVKESVDLQNSLVSPYVSFAKIVLYITAIIAVVFSVLNLIKHPKLLKKTLISVAALGVLLAIAYAMADDGATLNASGVVLEDGEAGSTSKWVSTGILYSLILGGVALLGVLADFVKSLVSK
jgi:Na+/H+ antiporter NhaD/arsenite permease-like protein